MKERVRKDPYQNKKPGLFYWLVRLVLLFVVSVACAAASFLLYMGWLGPAQPGAPWVGSAENLNPVERIYLQATLARQMEALDAPISDGAPATFVVEPGQAASTVASNLQEAGLLDNAGLFVTYLRYHGLDSQLAAGVYRIDPEWTIPELAMGFTEAFGQEITLRFLEGWRVEEMAAYLSTVTAAQIDGQRFLDIALRREPFDMSAYPTIEEALPPGATLEGFLFPDSYQVPLDADAPHLIGRMLANFEARVAPLLTGSLETHGITLYEAITLASIVEREAPLASERPHIAAVFYNRLAQGMPLQADPTVQYAAGFDGDSGSWWKSGLTQIDLQNPSPYNTYVHGGLPPGPIANPGLASLEAVAYPLDSSALFFVADCEAEAGQAGSHLFSETYDEHLAHVQRCRGQ